MMRSVSKLALTLAALLLFSACGDDGPPPPPVDSGRRDTSTGDGSMDSTVGDGATDSTVGDTLADSTPGDGGDMDASDGVGDTSVVDTGPGCVPTDRCMCGLVGIDCAGGCPSGTTCIDNACGEMFCFAAGGRCNTDADCPATSTCTMTATDRACIRGSTGCTDSRECPRGFACESDSCVDRRVPCITTRDCPWGYACFVGPESHGSYCEYIARACDALSVCFSVGDCGDYDGDGDTECGGVGPCPAAACTGNDACGTPPTRRTASCGDYGPCQSSCNAGFTCIDSWGDGQGECVPTGGSCTTNADCPLRQVCAPPNAGGTPACQAGNSG